MALCVQQVKGESVSVDGKKLTPVMQAITWRWRQAIVRPGRFGGFGVTTGWFQPAAVLEETPEGHRVLPVRDETLRRMIGLLTVAVLVPLILELLTHLLLSRSRN